MKLLKQKELSGKFNDMPVITENIIKSKLVGVTEFNNDDLAIQSLLEDMYLAPEKVEGFTFGIDGTVNVIIDGEGNHIGYLKHKYLQYIWAYDLKVQSWQVTGIEDGKITHKYLGLNISIKILK